MKTLFLHLSDFHIKTKSDALEAQVDKIVQAINYFEKIDECIIVLSGDISNAGLKDEFGIASIMLRNLIAKIKEKRLNDKWINVVVVPGNHDMDLLNNKRTCEDIIESYKMEDDSLKSLVHKDICI